MLFMSWLSHSQDSGSINRLFRDTGKIKLTENGWFTLSLETIVGTSTVTVGLYIVSFDRDRDPYKSKHPRWL